MGLVSRSTPHEAIGMQGPKIPSVLQVRDEHCNVMPHPLRLEFCNGLGSFGWMNVHTHLYLCQSCTTWRDHFITHLQNNLIYTYQLQPTSAASVYKGLQALFLRT
jgi:hypothetical protein